MSMSKVLVYLKNLSLFKKSICVIVSVALIFGLLPNMKFINQAYATQASDLNETASSQKDQKALYLDDTEEVVAAIEKLETVIEQNNNTAVVQTENQSTGKCHNCVATDPDTEFEELLNSIEIGEMDPGPYYPIGEASEKYGQNIKLKIEKLSALFSKLETPVTCEDLEGYLDNWVNNEAMLTRDSSDALVDLVSSAAKEDMIGISGALLILWICVDMDLHLKGTDISQEEPIEIVKCILNSDVLFKGVAKIIEAIQTKQIQVIVVTIMSLYPSIVDEIKKCLGEQDALSIKYRKYNTIIPILQTEPNKLINVNDFIVKALTDKVTGKTPSYDLIDYAVDNWNKATKLGINAQLNLLLEQSSIASSNPTTDNLTLCAAYPLLLASNFIHDFFLSKLNIKISSSAEPIDIIKCVLNSDVIFKGIAKLIEAGQTKNVLTFMNTFCDQYPKFKDEIEKCLDKGSITVTIDFSEAFASRCYNENNVLSSNGNTYSTLQLAIKNSPLNSSYKILKDIKANHAVSVSSDNLIIDLNGKTYSCEDSVSMLNINDGSKVTIIDNSDSASGKILKSNGGELFNIETGSYLSIASGTFSEDVTEFLAPGSTIQKNDDNTWTVKCRAYKPHIVADNLQYNGSYQVAVAAGEGYVLKSDDPEVIFDSDGNALVKDVKNYGTEDEGNAYRIYAQLKEGYVWEEGDKDIREFDVAVLPLQATTITISGTNCEVSKYELSIQDDSSIHVSFIKGDPSKMNIRYINTLGEESILVLEATPADGYTFAYWDVADTSPNTTRFKDAFSGDEGVVTISNPSSISATCLASAKDLFGPVWTQRINFVAGALEMAPSMLEELFAKWVDGYGAPTETIKDYVLNRISSFSDDEVKVISLILYSELERDVLTKTNNEGKYDFQWLIDNNGTISNAIQLILYSFLNKNITEAKENIKSFSAKLFNTGLGTRTLKEITDDIKNKPEKACCSMQEYLSNLFESFGSDLISDEIIDFVVSDINFAPKANFISVQSYLIGKINYYLKQNQKYDKEKLLTYCFALTFYLMFEMPLSVGNSYYFINNSLGMTFGISCDVINNVLKDYLRYPAITMDNLVLYFNMINGIWASCPQWSGVDSNDANFGKYSEQAFDYYYIADSDQVFEVNDQCYSSLASAVSAANNGDIITLQKDFETQLATNISDKNIILDLNGHSLTYKVDADEIAINATQRAFLAIVDSSSNKTGVLATTDKSNCLHADELSQIRFVSGHISQDAKSDNYVYDGAVSKYETATSTYFLKTNASLPKPVSDKMTYTGHNQIVLYDQPGSTFTSEIEGSEFDIYGNLTLKDVPTSSYNYFADEDGKYTLSVDVTIDLGFDAPEGFDGHVYFDYYPADVTLTSASDQKVFDGTPLTNHNVSVASGAMGAGEEFTYTFSGTQTIIGASLNTFDVADNPSTGAKLSNYNVTKQYGRLEVTQYTSNTVYLASSVNFNYVLDVAGNAPEPETNVNIYQHNYTDAQKFILESASVDGIDGVVIKNAKTGLAVDLAGGVDRDGQNIQMYQPNGTKAQLWIPEEDGNFITFKSSVNPYYAIDLSCGIAADEQNIQLYHINGTAAQKFLFVANYPWVPGGTTELEEGDYVIHSSVDQNYVLDVQGASTEDTANVWAYKYTVGNPNQAFHIKHIGNGYYTFVNCNSKKALDVAYCDVFPGTNVWQYTYGNGNVAQIWSIYENDDNTFTLINLGSGLALDLSGAVAQNETNVQGYYYNGTNAQKWAITKAE